MPKASGRHLLNNYVTLVVNISIRYDSEGFTIRKPEIKKESISSLIQGKLHRQVPTYLLHVNKAIVQKVGDKLTLPSLESAFQILVKVNK